MIYKYTKEIHLDKIKEVEAERKDGYQVIEIKTRQLNGRESFYFIIECPNGHNYPFYTTRRYYREGTNCRTCYHEKKVTGTYYKTKSLFSKHGATLLTKEKDYKGLHSKVLYVCEKCGKRHESLPYTYEFGQRPCGAPRGESHYAYKKEKAHSERFAPEALRWKAEVLKRDNYSCVKCSSEKDLHVHHIIPYSVSISDRTRSDNGATLCASCHYGFHDEFGWVRNYGREPAEHKDWEKCWSSFLSKSSPSKRIFLKRKGAKKVPKSFRKDYDPGFSWVPQQMFVYDGELFSTIPECKGYAISRSGRALGRGSAQRELSSLSPYIFGITNDRVKVNIKKKDIKKAAFDLTLKNKVCFSTCYSKLNT